MRLQENEVYPRMGGGNADEAAFAQPANGLSPHGRGKPLDIPQAGGQTGSIPAWAGETPERLPRPGFRPVYPRMGGGNIHRERRDCQTAGLSPHGRGKRHAGVLRHQPAGSIPAWAGETEDLELRDGDKEVYPRMGGGNRALVTGMGCCRGLSPHGRGKRL